MLFKIHYNQRLTGCSLEHFPTNGFVMDDKMNWFVHKDRYSQDVIWEAIPPGSKCPFSLSFTHHLEWILPNTSRQLIWSNLSKFFAYLPSPLQQPPVKPWWLLNHGKVKTLKFYVYFQLHHICECESEIIGEITTYLTRRWLHSLCKQKLIFKWKKITIVFSEC